MVTGKSGVGMGAELAAQDAGGRAPGLGPGLAQYPGVTPRRIFALTLFIALGAGAALAQGSGPSPARVRVPLVFEVDVPVGAAPEERPRYYPQAPILPRPARPGLDRCRA